MRDSEFISTVVAAVAGICFIGWLVAARFAPETQGLSLAEASSLQ